MAWRVLLSGALLLGMASVGHAQDGLRSASLPERPVATPPPGPADLFRARPDTYVPHQPPDRDRPGPRRHARGGLPLYGYGGWWPYVEYPDAPEHPAEPERRAAGDVRVNNVEPRAVKPDTSAAPPPVPVVPAPSRTFYVIPRCYAGDRPPDPSIHCDRTKLRTIR